MGSGPSIHLCSLRNPACLVLVSPYTSIKNVGKELFGNLLTNFFLKEQFSNISKIGAIRCPIQLIHGKKDELVPYSHSEELAEAA